MTALMRLINTNMLISHDDKALEYAGFIQFMVQLPIFLFAQKRIKNPPHFFHPLMGQMLEYLMTIFEGSAKLKGIRSSLPEF